MAGCTSPIGEERRVSPRTGRVTHEMGPTTLRADHGFRTSDGVGALHNGVRLPGSALSEVAIEVARHPPIPFQWEHGNTGREPGRAVNCTPNCLQSRCRLRSYPSCGNDNSASWNATRWTTSTGTDSTGIRWLAPGATKNHPEGAVANQSAAVEER